MLEDFGFMPAEAQSRSTASPSPCPSLPTTTSSAYIDQTITDDDDSEMADDPTAPNQLKAIPEFKVKVEDSDYSPSPGYSTLLHVLETEDDIHVQQETPDPPAFEFDVQIWQESLTLPPLCFNGSRSPSVCIHEESVTLPPLFFDHPVRKRKASGDLESDHSEAEDKMMPNTNKDNEEQQPVKENVGETE